MTPTLNRHVRSEAEYLAGWKHVTSETCPVPADALIEVKFRQGNATMICKAGSPHISWARDDDDPLREVVLWRYFDAEPGR